MIIHLDIGLLRQRRMVAEINYLLKLFKKAIHLLFVVSDNILDTESPPFSQAADHLFENIVMFSKMMKR